jgi:predicted TPR repeat methyltransferase
MLKLAEQRGVYDQLEKAELVDYLQRHAAAFDLVISADTLCYFGDLEEFSRAAFGALRPGGRLVFTVEAITDAGADPYRLQPHGRYAHDRGYVDTVLGAAGFLVEDLVRDVLRREAGLAVQGWLVNACKDGAGRVGAD